MCEHGVKMSPSIVPLCVSSMSINVPTECDLDGEQCAKTTLTVCEIGGDDCVKPAIPVAMIAR